MDNSLLTEGQSSRAALVVCNCGRSFKDVAARSQHQRDAKIHRSPRNETPIKATTTTTESTFNGAMQSLSLGDRNPDVLFIPFVGSDSVPPLHTETSLPSFAAAPISLAKAVQTPKLPRGKKTKRAVLFVKAGQTPEIPKGKKTKKSTTNKTSTTSPWNLNSNPGRDWNTGYTMGMMQQQNWALCDKECGWCGFCLESSGY